MNAESQERLEVFQDQALAAVEKKLSPAEGIIGRHGKSVRGRKQLG